MQSAQIRRKLQDLLCTGRPNVLREKHDIQGSSVVVVRLGKRSIIDEPGHELSCILILEWIWRIIAVPRYNAVDICVVNSVLPRRIQIRTCKNFFDVCNYIATGNGRSRLPPFSSPKNEPQGN